MRDGCMQLAKELVELLVIMFRPEVVDTSATKNSEELEPERRTLARLHGKKRTRLIQDDIVGNHNDSQIHSQLAG